MADPITDRKLQLLDTLLEKGQITQEMYDQNKAKVLHSIGDLAEKIESSGGYRKRLEDLTPRAETLSDLADTLKSKGSVVSKISEGVKTTPSDLIGIDPALAYKTRFANINKKLGAVGDVAKDVSEEAGLLKGQKGFAKMLPMLGLGAAGLAGLSIAQKAAAGELGQAGLESADLATDYIPGLGQAKMALRPSELGSGELPPEEMEARRIYNEARKAGQTGTPSLEQPLLAPENRATYDEMKKRINFNVLNRLK